MKVHAVLGPWLLESVYELCQRGMKVHTLDIRIVPHLQQRLSINSASRDGDF